MQGDAKPIETKLNETVVTEAVNMVLPVALREQNLTKNSVIIKNDPPANASIMIFADGKMVA